MDAKKTQVTLAAVAFVAAMAIAGQAHAARPKELIPGGLSLQCISTGIIRTLRGAPPPPSMLTIRISGMLINLKIDGQGSSVRYSGFRASSSEIRFHGDDGGLPADYVLDRKTLTFSIKTFVPANPISIDFSSGWTCTPTS